MGLGTSDEAASQAASVMGSRGITDAGACRQPVQSDVTVAEGWERGRPRGLLWPSRDRTTGEGESCPSAFSMYSALPSEID